MAKPRTTKLTFAVTLPQPSGVTIPEMRQYIVDKLRSDWKEEMETDVPELKVHLTNKEVHYG